MKFILFFAVFQLGLQVRAQYLFPGYRLRQAGRVSVFDRPHEDWSLKENVLRAELLAALKVHHAFSLKLTSQRLAAVCEFSRDWAFRLDMQRQGDKRLRENFADLAVFHRLGNFKLGFGAGYYQYRSDFEEIGTVRSAWPLSIFLTGQIAKEWRVHWRADNVAFSAIELAGRRPLLSEFELGLEYTGFPKFVAGLQAFQRFHVESGSYIRVSALYRAISAAAIGLSYSSDDSFLSGAISFSWENMDFLYELSITSMPKPSHQFVLQFSFFSKQNEAL